MSKTLKSAPVAANVPEGLFSPYWKIAFLLLMASLVIGTYYSGTLHKETAGAGFGAYFLAVALIFGAAKGYSLFSGKSEVSYSPLSIGAIALGHVGLLSLFYPFPAGTSGGGIVLFGKILGYLALPLAVILVSAAFGKWVLKKAFPNFSELSRAFKTVGSVSAGLAAFLFFVSVTAWVFGYSFWTTFGPLVLMAGVAFSEWKGLAESLVREKFRFENHSGGSGFAKSLALPLLSTEILFLVATFLVGVNFVNIVRPMPIGWDDLGVYMNFPKMMAESGDIGRLGMVAWQSLTGMGFLFHSAPQAFFLNQIGGLLSLIFVTFALSRLMNPSGERKYHVNLPLLFSVLVYAMPMIVFQQAKDMKLDPGLFAMTVASMFVLLEAAFRPETYGKFNIRAFALAGFLGGIAFAIKPTTLMLLLGGSAAICYGGLGLAGFYGFFALFVGLFTKLRLWDMMNVNYPKDDPAFLSTVSIIAFAAAAMFFAYAIHKHRKESWKTVFAPLLVFGLSAAVALMPWFGKNLSEFRTYGGPFSIGTLLSGVGYAPPAELKSVRSPEDVAAIEKAQSESLMSASGKTKNEDLGRYFGYEDGANNYLKLPFNLTYQRNQPGEYTEISFVYLALLPAVFAFLAYRLPLFAWAAVAMAVFEYAYFWNPATGKALTEIFAQLLLPGGYLPIAAFLLLPIAAFHFTLDPKKESNRLFLGNLAFLGFYGFVFVISAFGIVWYGIAVYFSMLVAIVLSLESAVSEEDGDRTAGSGLAASVTVFAIVATYLFQSAVPHGWNNFLNAGFSEFKSAELNQEESVFASHPDYLPILARLNLKDPSKIVRETIAAIDDPATKSVLVSNVGEDPDVESFGQILDQLVNTGPKSVPGVSEEKIRTMNASAKKARQSFYEQVLYPAKENRNEATIYRIGTFLTYFISDNRKRYLDDSLVSQFDQYVYDEDSKVTVERLKKLGVKYFLIDLNAATIDRDPRHDLTRRFENLLKTFRSEDLRLVKTDSLCLRAAMESSGASKRSLEEYMTLAGVNYESYTENGVVYRTQKQNACRKYLADIIKAGEVRGDKNAFLLPLAKYVENSKPKNEDDILRIVNSIAHHGWVALFEVK